MDLPYDVNQNIFGKKNAENAFIYYASVFTSIFFKAF